MAVTVLLFARVASATSMRPVRLEYKVDSASASCPDEATFRSAVAADVALVDEAGVPKGRQLSGTRGDCADLREAGAVAERRRRSAAA